MDVPDLGRLVITAGVVLLVVGNKIPYVGRLPGDLVFRKDGLTIFAPWPPCCS